jgi:hypothetical protein
MCKMKNVITRFANDEITPNIDWEFQWKSGGLDCL